MRNDDQEAAKDAKSVRLISYDGLRAKGVLYSKAHLRRLIARNRFPRPIYLSQRRMAWSEHAIDAWIAAKWQEAEARPAALRNADEYAASA